MKVFRRHALRIATVSVLAFLYGTHAFATNYELPASLTGTITHQFVPEIFPDESIVSDSLGVDGSSFTTDLGSWSSMSATLSAAAGNVIAVNLPAGKSGSLDVSLNYLGQGGVGALDRWSSTVQFLGLTGVTPTLVQLETEGRVQGNQVYIYARYTFTEPFSFQTWQLGINGPFVSGGSMTFTPLDTLFRFSYPDTVDGGQFVSFEPVPEPSQTALVASALGLGIVSITARHWRREKGARHECGKVLGSRRARTTRDSPAVEPAVAT